MEDIKKQVCMAQKFISFSHCGTVTQNDLMHSTYVIN